MKHIKEAIERSVSHNEISRLTFTGNANDVISTINALVDRDVVEVDHVMTNNLCFGVSTVEFMDVWAYHLTEPDQMIWRMEIRLEPK
jgi:hypothetical protein